MSVVSGLSGYEAIGLAGVGLYLIAYLGVQTGRIDGNLMAYACLNGAAAGCILISMIGDFNLASALVNAMFLMISLMGLTRTSAMAIAARWRQSRDHAIAGLAVGFEADLVALGERGQWKPRKAPVDRRPGPCLTCGLHSRNVPARRLRVLRLPR